MGEAKSWEAFKAEMLDTPELRAEFERERDYYIFARRLAMAIDERRQERHLSKAELARQIGVNPVQIRRLLTADEINPTLKTMHELLTVLGLELRLEPVGEAAADASDADLPATGVVAGGG